MSGIPNDLKADPNNIYFYDQEKSKNVNLYLNIDYLA